MRQPPDPPLTAHKAAPKHCKRQPRDPPNTTCEEDPFLFHPPFPSQEATPKPRPLQKAALRPLCVAQGSLETPSCCTRQPPDLCLLHEMGQKPLPLSPLNDEGQRDPPLAHHRRQGKDPCPLHEAGQRPPFTCSSHHEGRRPPTTFPLRDEGRRPPPITGGSPQTPARAPHHTTKGRDPLPITGDEAKTPAKAPIAQDRAETPHPWQESGQSPPPVSPWQ